MNGDPKTTEPEDGLDKNTADPTPDVEREQSAEPPAPETAQDLDDESDDGLEDAPTPSDETAIFLSDDVLISRIESLIFVAPSPVSVRRLGRILGIDGKRVRGLLAIIEAHYRDRGIVLSEVSGGFQFRSNPDNSQVIRHVFKMRPLRISRAALETLAIVAYRQPLTRSEVEGVRGVDCGGTLKYLFEKGLVRVIGRKEEPGRPIIYGTSSNFLELFGLKSLADLPALHEFSELWDEHRELVEEEEGASVNEAELEIEDDLY